LIETDGGEGERGLKEFDDGSIPKAFIRQRTESLVLQRATLGLLVTAKLKVLASLDRGLVDVLAVVALKLQHDLLGGLGLHAT